ncbi:MAG: hypothetical protein U9Q92_07420, partial [archaeon]|nr:hypothetical protein [archaeon]
QTNKTLMKTIDVLKELEKYAVFDNTIFRSITGKDSSYAKLYIHRLKEKGYIFEVKRNRYTILKDPLVVASRIVWPSYISLWSALRFHNLTEQVPHDVRVITTRKLSKSEVVFRDTRIVFVHTKPKYFFGFKKMMLGGFEVFMAEPEKAIIDGMLFRKISCSELAFIIRENFRSLNIKKLVNFAMLTENRSLIKRLGYILDAYGADKRSKLNKYIDNAFIPLEYAMPAKGEKDNKWRIIKNQLVVA